MTWRESGATEKRSRLINYRAQYCGIESFGRSYPVFLLENPEHAEHFPKYGAIRYNDRIHGVIFRLQTDMIVFFVESLYRGGVVNQRHNDIAVGGGAAAFHENLIPVKNPCVDHGIPLYFQDERFSARYEFCGKREIIVDILLREYGLTGGDCADYRKADHLFSHHLKTVIAYFDSAGLGRVALDIAVLIQ